MKTRFLHSIRWRVQWWHAVILLLAVVAFCLTTIRFSNDNRMRGIDRDVWRLERSLMRALMQSAQRGEPEGKTVTFEEMIAKLEQGKLELAEDTRARFEGEDVGFSYFLFQDASGRVLMQSPNLPADVVTLPAPKKDIAEDSRTIGRRRELARSSAQGLRGVVGRDISAELEESQRFTLSIIACGLGVWLLGLLGGWWLAGRAIRPIEAISRTATRIAEGNLEERIDTAGGDSELDQLGRVLNQTFERLHGAFERQKQFTADASHELRTPVSILLAETQRILKKEDRSPEEYREALQTCGQTAIRMRHLIEALLLLAREEDRGASHRTECDLITLCREALGHMEPFATEKQIRLHAELSSVTCYADAGALGILLSNLIGNAIQHHQGAGNVWLSCAEEEGAAVLRVRDDGPGIAEVHLPHLFERFYRVDPARAGNSGRTGLGLAIAKSIVTNHGGRIEVRSSVGQGTIMEVRLPLEAAQKR